jgi:hypothetical protein
MLVKVMVMAMAIAMVGSDAAGIGKANSGSIGGSSSTSSASAVVATTTAALAANSSRLEGNSGVAFTGTVSFVGSLPLLWFPITVDLTVVGTAVPAVTLAQVLPPQLSGSTCVVSSTAIVVDRTRLRWTVFSCSSSSSPSSSSRLDLTVTCSMAVNGSVLVVDGAVAGKINVATAASGTTAVAVSDEVELTCPSPTVTSSVTATSLTPPAMEPSAQVRADTCRARAPGALFDVWRF